MLASRHHGPLRLQRAFHPEADGTAHVVILHPPGGLVSGDQLVLEADVASGGRGLLTSTGATKLYRTRGFLAVSQNRLRVEAGADLEYVPQETVVFDDAMARCDTRVVLAAGARFMGWEVICLGRPAARERFLRGQLDLRFEVYRERRPLFIERGRVTGGSDLLEAQYGLRGRAAFGTFVATDCASQVLREELYGRFADDGTWAVTELGELAIVRVLAHDGLAVRRRLETARRSVRRAWGRESVDPAIWRS